MLMGAECETPGRAIPSRHGDKLLTIEPIATDHIKIVAKMLATPLDARKYDTENH